MNVWSHEHPAVWYDPRQTFPFTVRGPGVREQSFLTYDRCDIHSVTAWLRRLGIPLGDVAKYDGPAPCIFCARDARAHIPSWYGMLCRPTCIVQGCERDTCVQAVVGGYMPACLHHFFEQRVMVRPRAA